MEQPRATAALALVLDGSRNSQSIYEGKVVSYIWDQLAGQGDLSTYYLGQRRVASLPDQQPPTLPPGHERLRLIGPILSHLEPSTRLMVITTGSILDLDDFRDSIWRDRLLLVNMDSEPSNYWSHTVTLRENDAPAILVDAFFRLPVG